MSNEKRLPLKVVPPLQQDFYKPKPGGGPKKVFTPVTREFRQRLAEQVIGVKAHFKESFKEYPDLPAVARVKVHSEAIAKSHRPTTLLSNNTCPVIGAEGLGHLLLSVTPTGLDRLAARIEYDKSKQAIANLSTLSSIAAFEPVVEAASDGNLKVKLMRHHTSILDSAVDQVFRDVTEKLRVKDVSEIKYGGGLKVFRVKERRPDVLKKLSEYVGTQSIGPFPVYEPVRSSAIRIRSAKDQDFPAPDPKTDYPIVGIIDSGTSVSDSLLLPWRVARDAYVPDSEQDNTHGSFVAGLIVHGRSMNHSDARFPACSARFVDVVALSKSGTSEDKLLTVLESAIAKYPTVKVWNLSLGTKTSVTDRAFSDLGIALDRLQREHDVVFVVAAGNFQSRPLRGWPPEDVGEADRICAPADSLRSIVVGAIAHRDHNATRVKSGEPSPFSRRGPGPLYLPKPEICHIGGNCDEKGVCTQVGVLSLDGKGNLAEDLGTSFATPLVSTLFANLSARLKPQASPLMARALLVHAAALSGGKINPAHLRYRGFGVPPDIDFILACNSWECTLTFELSIPTSVDYEKAIFPMPKSLFVDGDVLKANILMTLIHDPEMDGSFGSEYCRSNIEVSMGTHELGKDGKKHQKKQVPEDPKLGGKAYEKDLVEHGFKWSPVKVYRREMVRGVTGQNWRLDLSIHHRSLHVATKPNRLALVITIADPEKKAPVYNELVAQMNALGWSATDLRVNPRIRA